MGPGEGCLGKEKDTIRVPTKGEEGQQQQELGEGCLASLGCQGCTNPSVQNRIKTITLFVLLFSDRVMIDLINICFCA